MKWTVNLLLNVEGHWLGYYSITSTSIFADKFDEGEADVVWEWHFCKTHYFEGKWVAEDF